MEKLFGLSLLLDCNWISLHHRWIQSVMQSCYMPVCMFVCDIDQLSSCLVAQILIFAASEIHCCTPYGCQCYESAMYRTLCLLHMQIHPSNSLQDSKVLLWYFTSLSWQQAQQASQHRYRTENIVLMPTNTSENLRYQNYIVDAVNRLYFIFGSEMAALPAVGWFLHLLEFYRKLDINGVYASSMTMSVYLSIDR